MPIPVGFLPPLSDLCAGRQAKHFACAMQDGMMLPTLFSTRAPFSVKTFLKTPRNYALSIFSLGK